MFDEEQRVSFPLTEQAPSWARHWFSDHGPIPVGLHDRVVLLLSELVANSVRHSGLSTPDEVEVSVRQIPEGFHVEVVDHGVGIQSTTPARPDEHFGLRFVDAVADRWGYSSGPTHVWFDVTGDEM